MRFSSGTDVMIIDKLEAEITPTAVDQLELISGFPVTVTCGGRGTVLLYKPPNADSRISLDSDATTDPDAKVGPSSNVELAELSEVGKFATPGRVDEMAIDITMLSDGFTEAVYEIIPDVTRDVSSDEITELVGISLLFRASKDDADAQFARYDEAVTRSTCFELLAATTVTTNAPQTHVTPHLQSESNPKIISSYS